LQQPAANLFAFYQKENALLVCFYLKFYLVGNTGASVKRSLGYGRMGWNLSRPKCSAMLPLLVAYFLLFQNSD
jgi:hypothetical protein